MDPSLFYTGIVAELYEPLKGTSQDWRPYEKFITQHGEPALELGCGDGEPLLDLRRLGLDVEGVDSSGEMLARLQAKADLAGMPTVLYEQTMEALDVPRRYRSIYLAGPTFTLLPDDGAAARALAGIRSHLEAGGAALVPLFIPTPTPAEQIGQLRRTTGEDGSQLYFSMIAEERDETARTQTALLRYEKRLGGVSTVVERPWILHWHTQDGFRALADAAGLATVAVQDVDGAPAPAEASEFRFVLALNGD